MGPGKSPPTEKEGLPAGPEISGLIVTGTTGRVFQKTPRGGSADAQGVLGPFWSSMPPHSLPTGRNPIRAPA
jgi:hypothetical protein